ncbi:MAG TPA: hypothetical protein VFP05_17865, partial [Thermomicrobiales bacterium]|nr:hypothetical protein [Thermomicrobiales bacterium]
VEHYRNTIQISNQAPLFHKNWTYIESTSALEDALTIRFNASTQERNSFHIRMTFSKPDGRVVTVREGVSPAFGSLRVSLSERDLREPFHLRIELDGDLAFSGMLDPRTDQIVRSVT